MPAVSFRTVIGPSTLTHPPPGPRCQPRSTPEVLLALGTSTVTNWLLPAGGTGTPGGRPESTVAALVAKTTALTEGAGAWVLALPAKPSATTIAHTICHAPRPAIYSVCQARHARWDPVPASGWSRNYALDHDASAVQRPAQNAGR